MKGLTLTQPWASLVALGAKTIETRSWSTRYRGPVAIHAGAGLGPVGGKWGLVDLCATEPFRSALLAGGIPEIIGNVAVGDLPRGSIIAVCDLIDVIETAEQKDALLEFVANGDADADEIERELAFGDYTPGRYAWVLAHIERLPEPVPCRGALGLWNVPAEVLARLAPQ